MMVSTRVASLVAVTVGEKVLQKVDKKDVEWVAKMVPW